MNFLGCTLAHSRELGGRDIIPPTIGPGNFAFTLDEGVAAVTVFYPTNKTWLIFFHRVIK